MLCQGNIRVSERRKPLTLERFRRKSNLGKYSCLASCHDLIVKIIHDKANFALSNCFSITKRRLLIKVLCFRSAESLRWSKSCLACWQSFRFIPLCLLRKLKETRRQKSTAMHDSFFFWCTGVKLFIGSKVQCMFRFEISFALQRGEGKKWEGV